MKRIVEYGFTSSLLIVIASALYAGRHWNATTALFPRAVGVPMFGVVLAILVTEIVKGRSRANGGDGDREDVDPDSTFRQRAGRMTRYFGWLFAFVAAIWAIGISYSIPLYILAYMRVEGRYGWWKCVVYASVTAGFIGIAYSYVFRVAWPEGALLRGLSL
jgi:hypothetical protein